MVDGLARRDDTRSRLRTLPYLPVAQRPEKITTKAGKEITVDKVKVEDKDKILKRGQVRPFRARTT